MKNFTYCLLLLTTLTGCSSISHPKSEKDCFYIVCSLGGGETGANHVEDCDGNCWLYHIECCGTNEE